MTGRGVLAIGILAAWGAGIAAFVQREGSRSPRERLAEVASRIAPGATYFAVHREGKHVGFASHTIDTIPGGLQVTDYLVGDLRMDDTLRRVTGQAVVRLSRGLGLREFTVTFAREGAAVRAVGRTLGDSVLEYVVQRGGNAPDTTRVQLAGPLLLPTLVPRAVALGDAPEVGRRDTLLAFDPVTMRTRALPVALRAESLFVLVDSAAFDPNTRRWLGAHADTVRGFHLTEDGGAGLDAWIDEQGRLIAVQGPAGLSLRRTAYEMAFENWRTASPLRAGAARPATGAGADGADRWRTTVIAAGLLAPGRPAARGELDTLRLLVRGTDLAALDVAAPRQQLRGDTVTITQFPSWRLRATTPMLPLRCAQREPFARALRAEPLLEVDHPAIVALARRLRGREALVDDVVRRLLDWVHDSVAKEPAVALPSAAATLRSRAGDVHEHAQLFVALARAAGIPARTVSGLLLRDGRFHHHAWAEVMLQEWIAVDPTLFQFPADASHLRLLVGGLAAQAELARVLEGLELHVLSATSPSLRRPPAP